MPARLTLNRCAAGHQCCTDVTCAFSTTLELQYCSETASKSRGYFSIISVEISSRANAGFLLFVLNKQEINSGDLRYAIPARCFRSVQPLNHPQVNNRLSDAI